MYFITGGAFNGKKAWILNQFRSEVNNSCMWHSCYRENKEGWNRSPPSSTYNIVIEGIEHDLRNALKMNPSMEAEMYFNKTIQPLSDWENRDHRRKLIIIGTDISKGIVPMKEEDRKWRDETGRLYQILMNHADKKYIIWFGIAKSL